jgi:hypothetical protein
MNQPDTANMAAAPPIRRSRMRLLLYAGLVLLALCVVRGGYVYFYAAPERRLQEAIAETDRLEPSGWRLSELEARRAVLPDGQNSALHVLAVKPMIPDRWASAPQFTDLFQGLPPEIQLDEPQTTALRTEIQKLGPALAEVRKLADLPNGRFFIVWSQDVFSILLPGQQNARELATVLSYDALLRAQENDLDGALASCRGILNAGRAIGDEPFAISQLIIMACQSIAVGKIERALAEGQPAEAALAPLQRLLEEEQGRSSLLIAARGERAIHDRFMQALEDGQVKTASVPGIAGETWANALISVPGYVKNNREVLLRHLTQAVEIAKLPPEQQKDPLRQWEAQIRDLPEPARQLCPAMRKIADSHHRNLAQVRCALAAVAAERYRQAQRRWPEALSLLVTRGLLTEVPADPYTGQPLRLKPLGDGILIYSVGPDGRDDGGKIDREHPLNEGTDLGFRLWDVPRRRQLPLPPVPQPPAPGKVSAPSPAPPPELKK